MANSKLVKFKDKKGNSYPYLYIDEMTGEFYVIKRVGPDIKKKPLGKDFVTARSNVLSGIQELSNEKPVEKGKRLIKDFYEIMIEEKEILGVKDSTMVRVKSIWNNRIAPYWEHLTKEEITKEQVTKFMTWHKRNLPGVQFVNTFKYLGNIFNVMIEHGEVAPHEIPDLIIPLDEQRHHEKEKGKYIDKPTLLKILENADDEERLIIEVPYITGFRKTEWAETLKEKLTFNKDGYYVVNLDNDDTKTGMARIVPLPKSLTEAITAQIKKHPDSPYLFPMKSDKSRPIYSQLIDKFWALLKKLAGIRVRIRFHDLRHTAARNFAKANVNPIIACTILGMSLAMYQKVYCKLQASDLILAVEQSAAEMAVA